VVTIYPHSGEPNEQGYPIIDGLTIRSGHHAYYHYYLGIKLLSKLSCY